jgi:hypothetical protein
LELEFGSGGSSVHVPLAYSSSVDWTAAEFPRAKHWSDEMHETLKSPAPLGVVVLAQLCPFHK